MAGKGALSLTDWAEYETPPDWDELEEDAAEVSIKEEWRPYSSSDIFLADLPEIPMLIAGLDIGPGRPNGFVGGPGSGKTLTAIACGLGVATGKAVFGEMAVGERGRVVHITYDMGVRAVALRYRQLANGMGIRPEEVEGQILVCAHPKITLNSPGALEEFANLLRGFSLCILDNARDAAPGADENDSTFGQYLTLFGSACEAAGTVGLYLHHTRKSTDEMTSGSLRGSSAILAASGAIWGLEGEGDEARTMRHLRPHDMSDGLLEPLSLIVEKGNRGAFETGKRTKALTFKIGYGRQARDSDPAPASEDRLREEIEAALSSDPLITRRTLFERLRGLGLKFRNGDVWQLVKELREASGIVVPEDSEPS